MSHYLLGNFDNVIDIRNNLLNNITVTNFSMLHWAIADSEGNSIVVEYINGSLNIHNNDVGVLTNDPDYIWHL